MLVITVHKLSNKKTDVSRAIQGAQEIQIRWEEVCLTIASEFWNKKFKNYTSIHYKFCKTYGLPYLDRQGQLSIKCSQLLSTNCQTKDWCKQSHPRLIGNPNDNGRIVREEMLNHPGWVYKLSKKMVDVVQKLPQMRARLVQNPIQTSLHPCNRSRLALIPSWEFIPLTQMLLMMYKCVQLLKNDQQWV